MTQSTATQSVLEITDAARGQVQAVLDDQPNADDLALWLEVSSVVGGEFQYDMYLQELSESGPSDSVNGSDGLFVVIPESSIDKLVGATLDLEGDSEAGGLVLTNPNAPVQAPTRPAALEPELDLEDPLTARVIEVVDETVNPSIASHGGQVRVMKVENATVYVQLAGGCQGCGLASVTLTQGIEVAIKDAISEIEHVVDVTDHASGADPYYS